MNIDTERLATDRAYWNSVAPDRATHYQPQQKMFYKRNGKGNWRVYSKRWLKSPATSDSALWVKRPEQGIVGLPSVGTECRHHSGRIYVVTGIANENTQRPDQYPVTIIYKNVENGTVWSRPASEWAGSFRPIRTPEQRERDDVISTAHALLIDIGTDRTVEATLAALYDAGMLKISSTR
jgi:hypothetical protein